MQGKAFVFSAIECVEYLYKKFPAFMSAFVSTDAEPDSNGNPVSVNSGHRTKRFKCYDGKGYGITRFEIVRPAKEGINNALYKKPETIACYLCEDGLFETYYTRKNLESGAGFRVSCMPIYDKNSNLIKSCNPLDRTTTLNIRELFYFQGSNQPTFIASQTEYSNTAPIVEDNGIKYIWLNKEKCELKQSKVMLLVTLDYVGAIGVEDTFYGKTTECAEKWAEKHMSPELKSMLVTANLDNEIATPLPASLQQKLTSSKTASTKNIDGGKV